MIFAPFSIKIFTTSIYPNFEAKIKAVLFSLSLVSIKFLIFTSLSIIDLIFLKSPSSAAFKNRFSLGVNKSFNLRIKNIKIKIDKNIIIFNFV